MSLAFTVTKWPLRGTHQRMKTFFVQKSSKAILTIDNWIIFPSLHYSTVMANYSRDASTHYGNTGCGVFKRGVQN